MIEIERKDLETLVESLFDKWQMSESEWSCCPDPDDLAFLLKMSTLSGNEAFIKDANDKIQGVLRYNESVVKDYTANLAFDESRRNDAFLDAKRIIKEAQERLEKLKSI
jgi:hypothetical protein